MNYLNSHIKILLATLLVMVSAQLHAKEIKQSFNGLTVNANIVLAEDKTLKDEVVLLTHGTLTHNGRETYRATLFKSTHFTTK